MPKSKRPDAAALELVRQFGLTRDDLVIEIGSGRGDSLRAVQACGPRVLGVEPNAWVMTRAFWAGIDTIAAAFTAGVADYILRRYGPARVIITGDADITLLDAAERCLAPGGTILSVMPTPTPLAAA